MRATEPPTEGAPADVAVALTDAEAATIAKRIGNEDDAPWNCLAGLAGYGEITEKTALALREVLVEATTDPERANAPEVADMRALIDYVERAGPRVSLPGWGAR